MYKLGWVLLAIPQFSISSFSSLLEILETNYIHCKILICKRQSKTLNKLFYMYILKYMWSLCSNVAIHLLPISIVSKSSRISGKKCICSVIKTSRKEYFPLIFLPHIFHSFSKYSNFVDLSTKLGRPSIESWLRDKRVVNQKEKIAYENDIISLGPIRNSERSKIISLKIQSLAAEAMGPKIGKDSNTGIAT